MPKSCIKLNLSPTDVLPQKLQQSVFYLEVESAVLPQNAQSNISEFRLLPTYSTQDTIQKLIAIFHDYEWGSAYTTDKNNAQNIVLSVEGDVSFELEQATLVLETNPECLQCTLIVAGENGTQTLILNTKILKITFCET